MVMALQTAITRRIDAFEAAVLTVGKLKAGTKHTVIPDTAGFEATVRTFDRGVRRKVRDVVHQCATHRRRARGRGEHRVPRRMPGHHERRQCNRFRVPDGFGAVW